jgi:hypothetical protein
LTAGSGDVVWQVGQDVSNQAPSPTLSKSGLSSSMQDEMRITFALAEAEGATELLVEVA